MIFCKKREVSKAVWSKKWGKAIIKGWSFLNMQKMRRRFYWLYWKKFKNHTTKNFSLLPHHTIIKQHHILIMVTFNLISFHQPHPTILWCQCSWNSYKATIWYKLSRDFLYWLILKGIKNQKISLLSIAWKTWGKDFNLNNSKRLNQKEKWWWIMNMKTTTTLSNLKDYSIYMQKKCF